MNNTYYETDKYVFFKGGYLSQWHESSMLIENIMFNNCEQWMMYSKAIYFKDLETANKILNTKDPKEQKKLGREVKNFNDDEWLKVADNIVYIGNYEKFTQNVDLRINLLLTNNKTIVEASPYDARWGNGLNIENSVKIDEDKWIGENRLGKILMKIRTSLSI